jgi:hypothetical protein
MKQRNLGYVLKATLQGPQSPAPDLQRAPDAEWLGDHPWRPTASISSLTGGRQDISTYTVPRTVPT